jgi:hypothetical protein
VITFKRSLVALAFTAFLGACSSGSDGRAGAPASPGVRPGGGALQANACAEPSGSSRRRAATQPSSRRGRGAGGRMAQLVDRGDCAPPQ